MIKMNKLIKLEMKKNNVSTYRRSILIIGLSMVCMLFLFAFIPSLDGGSDPDMELFSRYGAIDNLICIIEMCTFAIFAAAMYSRFLIEEYAGKRVYLLFIYPINRKKIFYAKIILVTLFSTGAMFILNLIMFGLFYGIEVFTNIVNDELSLSAMLHTLLVSTIFSIMAGIIGMISARIGFGKKSTNAPIIASVIIVVLIAQFLSSVLFSSLALLVGIFAVLLIIGIIVLLEFAKKIENMEEAL